MAVLKTVFPPTVESALALSAAPPHLRADATVYTYTRTGFMRTRTGTNGFACLLNRDAFFYGASAFKPTCWDAVGAQSYLPVMLAVGAQLAAGASYAAIAAEIDAGFASRRYSLPTSSGVAYMLAGDLSLDPQTGRVIRQLFPGHYMFYALGATNTQLGVSASAARADATLPSVFAGGAGGAQGLSYIIAMPGDTHRRSGGTEH
jgi:hypothetical protein